MSILDTSNSSLSSSFYLGKYYDPAREAKKASNRKNISKDLLFSYDSNALNKFVKDIRRINFNTPQKNAEANLKGKVGAFVSIYNNFNESSKKVSSNDDNFRADQIKKITKSQEKALKKIGITINEDASLEMDEDKLKEADIDDVKSLFSNSSDFINQLKRISSKLNISI